MVLTFGYNWLNVGFVGNVGETPSSSVKEVGLKREINNLQVELKEAKQQLIESGCKKRKELINPIRLIE